MSVHLFGTVERYRCDSEDEARAFIEAQRANTNSYELTKYSNEAKTAKQKGEVIDEWYRVTLYKNIDSEKEPVSAINVIKYEEE